MMIENYLFGLNLYHINLQISFKAFNILKIALIIKTDNKIFSEQKTICILITNIILEMLIIKKTMNFNKLNIKIIFKFVLIGFLY